MTAADSLARTAGSAGGAEWTTRIVLTVIGVFTMTPALALINPAQLTGYGVADPDLVVLSLLQHRGALQLALGAAIVWAAFNQRVRGPVLLAATFTKGVGVLLIVTRPEVFARAPGNIGLWFDLVCLLVLPVVVIRTIITQRRQRQR